MTGAIDRLWAGWRSDYVGAGQREAPDGCVFCELLASGLPDEETSIVWRSNSVAAILNAFPYGTGHILVMPVDHVGELDELSSDHSAALWQATQAAVVAIRRAYAPNGVNVGMNLGTAAGAGIPGHLHMHALPRWNADTNFMSAVANARVLPEALVVTWRKLRDAWPQ